MGKIGWMLAVWACLITYRGLYQAVDTLEQWSWPRVIAELLGIAFAILALHIYATRVHFWR
jgi:hypothetical protein